MISIKHILLTAIASLLFIGCGSTSRVPITGRKHTLLVSDAEVLSLSKQEYSKFMKSARPSADAANTAMVKLERVWQMLLRLIFAAMGQPMR